MFIYIQQNLYIKTTIGPKEYIAFIERWSQKKPESTDPNEYVVFILNKRYHCCRFYYILPPFK